MDVERPRSPARPRVLFINPAKAQCSIHESGCMMHRCAALCPTIELDYVEINADNRSIPVGYDCYAFNYHHQTMGWLDTQCVRELPGLKLTFVLEMLPNEPFVQCPSGDFQAFCVLDPTMCVRDRRVYAFPRPLERPLEQPVYREMRVPVVGTFGFPTIGKGFDRVVDAVAQEFPEAIVKINLPDATYAALRSPADPNQSYAQHLAQLCRSRAREGITVEVTHDFLSKEQLIQWCAGNTLNCFLYDRDSPGLAATTDQAIASGRPLAVSGNQTFRHIHPYIKPYPLQSLSHAIQSTMGPVRQMQEDWSPEKFAERFEFVLRDQGVFSATPQPRAPGRDFQLRRLDETKGVRERIGVGGRVHQARRFVVDRCLPPRLVDAARRTLRRAPQHTPRAAEIRQYIHPCLGTFSQHEEDFVVADLLSRVDRGAYVDVGANDPCLNNNTYRLYQRGWRGVNLEPGREAFRRLCELRPEDINLNVGLASRAERRVLFEVIGDETLSSFRKDQALGMAQRLGLRLVEREIEVVRLQDVFVEYLPGQAADFLSIDAEGAESEILEGDDWSRYRPSVVMLEIDKDDRNLRRIMRECGYVLVYNNSVNGIFVDRYSERTEMAAFRSTSLA